MTHSRDRGHNDGFSIVRVTYFCTVVPCLTPHDHFGHSVQRMQRQGVPKTVCTVVPCLTPHDHFGHSVHACNARVLRKLCVRSCRV